MSTVTFTMVSGRTIRLMVTASIFTPTALNMMVTGSKINNMVRVKSNGRMVHNTQATTNLEEKKALENSIGPTRAHMLESSLTTISTDRAYISGPTTDNMKAAGSPTRCTAVESSLGQTDVNMKESTSTTRRKVTEYSPGPTEGNMTVSGWTASKRGPV